ncbi:MAG: ABC transporter permease [Thermoanaerobaculia bacterium]
MTAASGSLPLSPAAPASSGDEIVVLGATSGPGDLKRRLERMRRDLARAPALARHRLRHDLAARYRGSRLGPLLALVPALVVTVWAVAANRAAVITPGPLAVPYALWALTGIVLWQAFADAMRLQIDGLMAERALLAKVALPPESLILARLAEAALELLLKLAAVGLLALALRAPLGWTAALLPITALPLLALGTAVGLLLAPFGALYQDIPRALPAAVTLGFFSTPILFPEPPSGLLRAIVLANPVTHLLELARDLALSGSCPRPAIAAGVALGAFALLPVGWLLYRLALPHVLERSGV